MKNLILFSMLLFSTSFTGIGQELPTIGKVFNFHKGDEFHYEGYSGWFPWPQFFRVKIIGVDYSLDGNEVIYTIVREWGSDNSIPNGPDTLFHTYINLDSSMFYYELGFQYDTLHYFSKSLCGAEIYGAHYGWGGTYPKYLEKEYGIGLGLTHFYRAGDTGYTLSDLVYYIKDGEECGSPITSVGINETTLLNGVSIFPNPNKGLINIDLGILTDVSIKVLSVRGQLIYYKENINTPKYQFELDATPGIYILEISVQSEKQQFKLIKQ